jgi:hypothetical protein
LVVAHVPVPVVVAVALAVAVAALLLLFTGEEESSLLSSRFKTGSSKGYAMLSSSRSWLSVSPRFITSPSSRDFIDMITSSSSSFIVPTIPELIFSAFEPISGDNEDPALSDSCVGIVYDYIIYR